MYSWQFYQKRSTCKIFQKKHWNLMLLLVEVFFSQVAGYSLSHQFRKNSLVEVFFQSGCRLQSIPSISIKINSTAEFFNYGFCKIALIKILGNFLRDLFCHSFSNRPLTAWKMSKYGVIFGPYFPVFELNTKVYWQK